jgi:hypothetical protein
VASVTVRGVASGYSELRILEPSTHDLDDEVRLRVAAVDHITALSLGDGFLPPGARDHLNALTGATFQLAVRYAAADGTNLADEGARLTVGPDNVATGTQGGWDAVTVHTGAAAGTATLAAAAGSTAHTVELRVLDHIDAIEPLAADTDPASSIDRPLDPGGATLCFRAVAQGESVVGAQWQFAVEGGSTGARVETAIFANCAALSATSAGAAAIDVTAGGTTQRWPITFSAPAMH